MLSPFVFWPRTRLAPRSLLLRISADAVLLVSLASGVRAMREDLRMVYRYAGPSIFAPVDRRQYASVRERLQPGEALLVYATTAEKWYTCLWQRALYPRNPVIVRYNKSTAASLREDIRRFHIRHAVAFGNPPPDPGFWSVEELGEISGQPGEVRFGALRP